MGNVIDLPYFDLLLENREEAAAKVFSRYVHWGYWEDPSSATLDLEEFAAAMDRLNDEVLAGGDLADGQAILDAGCGFGGTLGSLKARYPKARLTGVNIDSRQLTLARLAVPGVEFVEGDACALPFPDGSFDRALAVECIFHFPSRAAFLKEAARVLKPGGLLSLSDFVPASTSGHGGPVGRFLEGQISKGYGKCGDGWKDGGYAEMAAAAGLEIVLDRDITAETLPTYPILLGLIKSRSLEGPEGRMLWPTRLLMWLSNLRLVRYRIVAFRKP